jgi:carboxyl-terminal processing protease
MKSDNKSQGLLRRFAFILCLFSGVYFLSGSMHALTGTVLPTHGQFAAAITQQTGKFDGHVLYQKAFEALRDYHKELADPAKRAAFVKEWEHKFDNTGDLNTEAGTDAAVAKMMESLGQRFDYYFDAERTQAEKDEVDATLVGIGVTISLADQESLFKGLPDQATRDDVDNLLRISKGHELTIGETMEGGPSDGVLKPGDIITEADGRPLDGMKESDAIKLIRGQEGTTVTLTVVRTDGGVQKTLKLSIKRARVTVKVVHTKDLGDGIAYVKLDNFMSKNAVAEFGTALQKAVQNGSKGVVIDLRNNPGGDLNIVLTMSAMLIPDGTVLVTEAREPGADMTANEIDVNRNFVTQVNGTDVNISKRPPLVLPENMPIVVLVNNGSASASEILSGALQYHHRALIVGKPTHGKGVGQTVIDLPFGRRMHVTNFEFLPGGKRMDWIGVIPEVEVDVDRAAAKAGKDNQLDTAVDQMKKLIATEAARSNESDQLKKKNHEDFDKELRERNKPAKP